MSQIFVLVQKFLLDEEQLVNANNNMHIRPAVIKPTKKFCNVFKFK